MGEKNALQLLACQLATASHIEALEKLGDLQVKRLVLLLLVELGDLALDLLHDLHFALKELRERAHSVVARLGNLSATQRLFLLAYFVDQAARDLLFGARDDKIEELFVGDHRLIVIGHQVDQESALLLRDVCLEGAWLQVAGKEDKEAAIEDSSVVLTARPGVSRVLYNRTVHRQLLRALHEDFRAVLNLLVQLVC